MRGRRGQASVELVAVMPLLLTIVLAAAQLLAAGVARELAAHAAQAGAMAMLQGGDPVAAARAAVPAWSGASATVDLRGRTVVVELRPPSPFAAVAALLVSRAQASAGA